MENKQQTAVEWLYNQIPLEWTIKGSAKKIFEQAKEMEKQQIVEAYKTADQYVWESCRKEGAERYYKETYGE